MTIDTHANTYMSEVKSFTPIDLALLRRLLVHGLRLDVAETIENPHALETAILGAVGVKSLGRPTYILRQGSASYAAQLRLEETVARITFIAPEPQADSKLQPWLYLLDGLVSQAGKRGAQVIMAEMPVDSVAFELFRNAHFTVYSRERLYRLNPPAPPLMADAEADFILRAAETTDHFRLCTLYASTVPQLVQHVNPMPQQWNGLVLILRGRLVGYLDVQIGKTSLLIQPYFHPELYDMATAIFSHALHMLPERVYYVRLRAYQDWVRPALEVDLGFTEQTRYALMARHTVIRKAASAFSPLAVLEQIALTPSPEIALEISSKHKEKS